MNPEHNDAEYRVLQKQVKEARQLVRSSWRLLREAIAELEEFIQERAA